jgi:hypothetical protein
MMKNLIIAFALSLFSIPASLAQMTCTGSGSSQVCTMNGSTINAPNWQIGSTTMTVGSAYSFFWTSGACCASPDTTLERSAGGILKFGNSIGNTLGSSLAAGFLPNGKFAASGQTTAVTTQNIVAAAGATGMYQLNVTVTCDTSVSTATVIPSVSYTDPSSTVQTITGGTATCTTLGASSIAQISQAIRAKVGTAITVSTTIANSPNYDIAATAAQITTN